MGKRILIVQQPGKGLFEKGKLKSILKKCGYDVVGDVTSHAEGLRLVRQHKPDLVVFEPYPFDKDEEYYSNLSLLKNMRLENSLRPVIMCGKREDHIDGEFSAVDIYLGRGAADFIFQPYEAEDVHRRIERLFSVPETDMTVGKEMWVMVQQFDHSDRTWIHHLLWENGYGVELACNPFECLRVCKEAVETRKAEPDLLIAEDIDAVEEFRKEYPDVAVMMCCSRSQEGFIERCVAAGAQGFLLKPFKVEELWKRVHFYCWNSKNSQLRRQAREQELAKKKAAAQEAGKVILVITPSFFLKLPPEIREALDENGYRVVTETFERDYLAVYQRERPNLVLLDRATPAILESFKKEDPSVPVLVLRYPKQKNTVEEFLSLGAADCLTEPFDPETFMTYVEGLRRRPAPAQPKKEEPPASEPETVQTPYRRKIANMTTEELIAEIDRVTSMKVTDTIARVLVVQKAEFMQVVIQDALKKDNFEVAGMTSEAWRCLELYREIKPDLVIMDTVLAGDIDGIKILQLIRKENPSARVLMTGPSDMSVAKECMESGAKEFLAKPFKAEELLKKVWDTIRK